MSAPGSRLATRSVTAALVTLLASGLLASAVLASETVRLTGLVADTDGPVEGALIRILEPRAEPDGWVVSREWGRTRSGGEGRFEIEVPKVALQPWLGGESWNSYDTQWSLEVRHAEYAVDLRQLYQLRSLQATVDLGPIVLGSGWSLEGQVLAAADERRPLEGARVLVWPRGLDRAIETLTAADGSFALRGLPDTEMTLAVAHADHSPCIREPDDLSGLIDEVGRLGLGPLPNLEPCVEERLTGGRPGSTVRLERPIELHPWLGLWGRVTDPARKPLAGVRVRAAVVPPNGAPRDLLGEIETRTWFEGLFFVRVGRRDTSTMLEFRHPGHTTQRLYTKLAEEPEELDRPWTRVGVALVPGQPIRGRATLASGAPAFEARIELLAGDERGPLLRTQVVDKGAFDLGAWDPGTYRVVAHADGLEAAAATVEVGPDSTSPERLVLVLLPEDRFDLMVRVRDADDNPVVGALVSESTGLRCETDRRGQCTLRDLERPEEMLFLTVESDGFLPAWPRLEMPVGDAVEVRLEPVWFEEVDVAGSVRDEEGLAVAGAVVTIGDPTQHAPPTPTTRTGLDGRFELRRVPQGAYWMTVEAAGYAEHTTRLKAAASAEPLAIELVRGATIHGEVLELPPDAEIRGAVSAQAHDPRSEWEPGVFTWKFRGYPTPWFTGMLEGSSYRIEGVEPGFYVVSLNAGRSVYGTTVEVHEGEREVRLDLPLALDARTGEVSEEIALTGRIVEAASGRPVAGAEIAIWSWKTTSAADGAFRFDSLPTAGWVPIDVAAAGYADLTRHLPGDELSRPLILELAPAADLHYRVLWSDGEPVEWHELRLLDASGEELRSTTFSDGEVWEDLPAGDHTLRVDVAYAERRIPVTLPGPEVVVVFEPAGSLTLRVPDLELEYGEPGWLDGVTTLLTPISTAGPARPLLLEGELWASGLAPGLWNVLVEDGRGRSWTAQLEIAARQDKTVLLD